VDLVNEQERALPLVATLARGGKDLLQVGHAREDR
jgi:hypothetical protein